MPSKRKSVRTSLFSGVIALLVLALLPHLPADAHSAGPAFELRFPQEVGATEFGSTYGDGRSGGRRHEGNDLMAPKMTEVYAAADGIVDTIEVSRNAGRYITISHVEGWSTTYMHLNNDRPGTDDGAADWRLTVAPGVEMGSAVFAGQLIGYVGDSGNAEWTGSHTHFELRHDDAPIDPYQYLKAAAEKAATERLGRIWRLAAPLEPDVMG